MKKKIMLAVNALMIAAVLTLNYFYQRSGFDFSLKCICSGLFAALGIINLAYALRTKQGGRVFYIWMSLGLVLAFLGDVLIGFHFIAGAGTFAVGHICFVIAYCFLHKPGARDLAASGVLFAGASLFLLLCPLLKFEVPAFKAVCIVYALIISLMLGKAIGNFTRQRSLLAGTIAAASALFFFSDLMLVLDRFIGLWSWTDEACMGTYYPALCMLAFAMYLKISQGKER